MCVLEVSLTMPFKFLNEKLMDASLDVLLECGQPGDG